MKRLLLVVALMFAPLPAFATVASTTSKVIYTGDNSSSTFSFSFNIYKTSDLVVQKVLISTGAATTLALNTDYTVALTHAVPTPGSVTLLAGALSSTYQLVILRSLPLTQLINISDPYYTTPAATWNEAHDRSTMLAQQLQEQINRSILGPTTSSTTLTLPAAVGGSCLGWANDGSLSNLTCSGSGGGGGGGGTGFNPPIPDSQLSTITTASKVNASAIYSLPSLPSGAGLVPIANLPVGTSASNIVQLNGSAQLPAVSGVNLTNISGANLVSLASTPSGSGVIPIANLATGTPTGSKFIRDDGTLQTTSGAVTFVSATAVAGVGTTGNISITAGSVYLVKYNLRNFASAQIPVLRFNGDSGADYDFTANGFNTSGTAMTTNGASQTGINLSKAITSNLSAGIIGYFYIDTIANANVVTYIEGTSHYQDSGSTNLMATMVNGGRWSNTGAVTSFSIIAGDNFTGTVYVYKLQQS